MLAKMSLRGSLGYALFALGCVAHDTASDRSAVQALVREHSALAVAPAASAPPAGSPAASTAMSAAEVAPDTASEADAQRELERLGAQPLTLEGAVRIALWNNRELRAR